MKNRITPLYDLTDEKELENYKINMGKLSPEFTCQLDETDLTISLKYKGRFLETTELGEKVTAFLLRRDKHKDLEIIDLERTGAIYSVELSGSALDTINFHIDPYKDTISAETVLDIPEDEEERNKIVEAINNNATITILDDGATSDEDYAELKKGIEGINSNMDSSDGIDVKISQYGPMWIEIEVEKPKTFGDFINKVDGVRNSLLT